jgi:formamidopyrimidine-DNA glycosylase
MPELPEVETYVRELTPDLRGRTVTGVVIRWPRIIAAPGPDEFTRDIVGQRFASFGRRGKYMRFGLVRSSHGAGEEESGDTLIVHLRMTGKLQIRAGGAEPGKHTHLILDLDDGRQLHYTDPRKFGRIWLVPDPEPVFYKLGPEPLGDEFTPAAFAARLHGRRASIKALLLNQRIVAGVGNIYADESLFLAGVHPARPGGELTSEEISRLHAAIRAILTQAIDARGSSLGGSSLQNYQRPGGESGGYQDRHQVFQRTGQPCPVCGTPIERIVLAQRSTHFCPACQGA